MTKFLPILGPDAWVPQGYTMLDNLMAHLFESNHSQNSEVPDDVSSIAWEIQRAQGDIELARTNIEAMLLKYFRRYFEKVDCRVYVIDNDSMFRGELGVSAIVVDKDGKEYQLSEAITKKQSAFRTTLDYFATGDYR